MTSNKQDFSTDIHICMFCRKLSFETLLLKKLLMYNKFEYVYQQKLDKIIKTSIFSTGLYTKFHYASQNNLNLQLLNFESY